MKYSKLKMTAMVGAASLALLAGNANAQTSQIGATFATDAGITTLPGNNMDFGTWVISNAAADTVLIPLTAVVAGSPPVPVPTGAADPTTIVVNTVAPGAGANVTVETASPLALQIEGSVTTDFSEPTLSLGALTFTDSDNTNTLLLATFALNTANSDFADTQTANTPETIGIGGTLTVSGTPAASTTFSDALIDVSFSF